MLRDRYVNGKMFSDIEKKITILRQDSGLVLEYGRA